MMVYDDINQSVNSKMPSGGGSFGLRKTGHDGAVAESG
jgi:hypothetical protein